MPGQTGAVKKLAIGEESPRSRREKRLSSRTPRVRTNSGEREQYSPKPRTGEDSQLDRQLQEIELITVDTKAALRAFTLAEKDAGAGLEPGMVLGVLQQLLGHHDQLPTIETEVASRQFTSQFPPGTTLDFEGDFLEILHIVTEKERLRRLWSLVAEKMHGRKALESRCVRVFEHFDFDGRGAISTADLQLAVRALDFYLEQEELVDVASGMGGIPELEVDAGWFNELVMRCEGREDLRERRRAELMKRAVEMRAESEAVFALWDLQGTGRIPVPDIAQGLNDCGWDAKSVEAGLEGGKDGCACIEEIVYSVLTRGVWKELPMERV